jgi:hypothetical protein
MDVISKPLQHCGIVSKDALHSVHTYVATEAIAVGTIVKAMIGTMLPVLNHWVAADSEHDVNVSYQKPNVKHPEDEALFEVPNTENFNYLQKEKKSDLLRQNSKTSNVWFMHVLKIKKFVCFVS